jgi:hypothetical protein
MQIFSRLFVIVWRRQAVYSYFLVRPITLDTIIKYELDYLKNIEKVTWFGIIYKNLGGEIRLRELERNLTEAGLGGLA